MIFYVFWQINSLSCRCLADVITLSRPSIYLPVVFSKAPFLVLCFSSCTLPPQHSHLLPFTQPSPLCRRHPTVFLILPAKLRPKQCPPTKFSSANLFPDNCQSVSQSINQSINHHLLRRPSPIQCSGRLTIQVLSSS